MSLFSFLKTRPESNAVATADQKTEADLENVNVAVEKPLPEIPENVFVEYESPIKNNMEPNEGSTEENTLETLYQFLGQNLEKKGYEDALVNPDTSYMEEHVRYIQNDISLTIAKVKTYYSEHIKKVVFHIETRKRNGMIETVDELLTHKATTEEKIKSVESIEAEAEKGIGLSQTWS